MIIERLKTLFDDETTLRQREIIVDRAIDHIERLRAENEKLRAALKPFAAFAHAWEKQPLYGMDNTIYALHGGEHCGGVELKLTDLRAAAAALKETGDG